MPIRVQERSRRSKAGSEPSTGVGDPADAAAGADRSAGPTEGVALSGVSRSFQDRSGRVVQALADLSLNVDPASVHAVVGPSGCGKSTLLELVCRLQAPDSGSVRCPPAALMPQRDLLLPWMSALDNAALPLRISGQSRSDARALAQPLFGELGLAGFESARPGELSGGMRQRVAFLRTLLSGKQLLCLDEPFGALDAITRMQMQEWLAETLERTPRTVILVTHDVEEAVLLADTVSVLSPRPGSVVCEIDVQLERPRSRSDEAVIELRERALRALGLEDR